MTKMIAELIEQRFGLPSTAGHDTPAEGELTAILSHRTHRRYTDMPISEDLMQQVLAAGLSAPAKSDLQQVAVPRVEDPGIRRAVAELLPAMPWVARSGFWWCAAIRAASGVSANCAASRSRTTTSMLS